MTVDEVKILLSDLNRGYNTPYSSAEQATIERLYYEVLGKRLSGCRCPDRWHDAVLEINSYIKKHGKMKEKSNYKLRAGVILQIAGSSEIYTNDNLTDEVAAAFLKEHPNAAGRFEVIPTAKKDAEAPKAGGESSELEAAHNRIAILESEKAELESRCAALQARIDAAAATETAATNETARRVRDAGAVDLLYAVATAPHPELPGPVRQKVLFRGAYVLERIYFDAPEAFMPRAESFCRVDFAACANASAQRHFGKIMADLLGRYAPESGDLERIAETAAGWAVSPEAKVAVKVWAVEVLKRCRERVGWVAESWDDIVETVALDATPGIESRMRKSWKTRS